MSYLNNSFLSLFPNLQALFSKSENFSSNFLASPSALSLSPVNLDPFGNQLAYTAENYTSTSNIFKSSGVRASNSPIVLNAVPNAPATPQQDESFVLDPNQFQDKTYEVPTRWKNDLNMAPKENCKCEKFRIFGDPYVVDDEGGITQFPGLFENGQLKAKYYNAYSDNRGRNLNVEFTSTGNIAPGAKNPEALISKAQMDFGTGDEKVKVKFDANGFLDEQFSGLAHTTPNGDGRVRGNLTIEGAKTMDPWTEFLIPLMDGYAYGNDDKEGIRLDDPKDEKPKLWKNVPVQDAQGNILKDLKGNPVTIKGMPVNEEGIPRDKYNKKPGNKDADFKEVTVKGYYTTFTTESGETYQVLLYPTERYYGKTQDPKDLNVSDYLKNKDSWSAKTGYNVKIISKNNVTGMDGNERQETGDFTFEFEDHPSHPPSINITGRVDLSGGTRAGGFGGETVDMIVDKDGKYYNDDEGLKGHPDNKPGHNGHRHGVGGYVVDSLDSGAAEKVGEDLEDAAKNPTTSSLNVAGKFVEGTPGAPTSASPAQGAKVDKLKSPSPISLTPKKADAFKTADLKVAVKADVKATAAVKADKAVVAKDVKLDVKAAATK